jgi:hypothetical protein
MDAERCSLTMMNDKMAHVKERPPTPPGHLVSGILRSIALNAAIPLILYRLTKTYLSGSDIIALSVAGLFPFGESVVDVTRSCTLDPIAVIVLLGVTASMVGVALGGSVKLLLIRESLFTGALGIACFVSLALPRPLMFYFGRHFTTGGNPDKIAEFNANWRYPYFRFVNRVITVVWGVAFTSEFLARVILVYTLPPAAVLAVSPLILGGITVATIFWTFAYIRHARARGEEMRRQVGGAG